MQPVDLPPFGALSSVFRPARRDKIDQGKFAEKPLSLQSVRLSIPAPDSLGAELRARLEAQP